ncbi:hypothetical protein ACVBIO_04685 [Shewanella sp. 0m-8]
MKDKALNKGIFSLEQDSIHNTPEVVNDLNRDYLVVECISKGNDKAVTVEKTFKINHPKILPHWHRWVMKCIVLSLGGWTDETRKTLLGVESTVIGTLAPHLRIAIFASQFHPNLALSKWTREHVIELLKKTLYKELDILHMGHRHAKYSKSNKEHEIFSSHALVHLVLSRLMQTRSYYDRKLINDGVTLTIQNQHKFIENIFQSDIKTQFEHYDIWKNGGSFGTIPVAVTMALLAYSVSILESAKTSFLLDFFNLQREEEECWNLNSIFSKQHRTVAFVCGENPIANYPHARDSKNKYLVSKRISKRQRYLDLVNQYRDSLIFHESLGFPCKSQREFHDTINNVYMACYLIFLTLSGIRHSELLSLTGDDYEKHSDGTWVYRSRLIKTENGAYHVRAISPLVSEAFNALCRLSLTPKSKRIDGQTLPLFGRYVKMNSDNNLKDISVRRGIALPAMKNQRKILSRISYSTYRADLTTFFNQFLEKQPNFRELTEYVTPHQFRHSYVEFAMRRFEGNITRMLKMHMRHSMRSNMIDAYTRDKITEDVKENLERDYILEIVGRVVQEYKSPENALRPLEFYGSVAKRIHSMLDSSMVVKPENFSQVVETIAAEVETIKASDYGYCMVMKATREQAKCLDKTTKTPKATDPEFSMCSGCPNFLVSKLNSREAILRIKSNALLHNTLINVMDVSDDNPFKKESKDTFARAMSLLQDMGES